LLIHFQSRDGYWLCMQPYFEGTPAPKLIMVASWEWIVRKQ